MNNSVEYINELLMDLEIKSNGKTLGVVYKIEAVIDNGCEYFQVYTTLGKTFNANKILNMIAINNNNNKKVTDENSDDNVTVLPIGYPDGTEYAKKFSGPKKIHISIPYVTEAISNKATVSNSNSDEKSEVISITSHSSSDNSFPEENHEGYAYRIRAIQNQRRMGNI